MHKIILIVMMMLLSIPSLESTIQDTYTQLKKNPRYKKMSLLEIAIDRGEFEAIQYFEFRASPAELKKGRVLIQNKMATFDAIIAEDRVEFLTGPEKVASLEKIEETRRLKKDFEGLLREFNRKLESIDTEEAARRARTKTEAAPAA